MFSSVFETLTWETGVVSTAVPPRLVTGREIGCIGARKGRLAQVGVGAHGSRLSGALVPPVGRLERIQPRGSRAGLVQHRRPGFLVVVCHGNHVSGGFRTKNTILRRVGCNLAREPFQKVHLVLLAGGEQNVLDRERVTGFRLQSIGARSYSNRSWWWAGWIFGGFFAANLVTGTRKVVTWTGRWRRRKVQ